MDRQGAGSSGSVSQRRLFLAMGVLPSFWLLRRMPIGFFFMVGGWTMILAGLAAVPVAVLAIRRTHLRRWAAALIAVSALGVVLLAMIPLARADARGQRPPLTDDEVRVVVLILQAVIASWALSASIKDPRIERRAVVAVLVGYGLLVATVGVRQTVGAHLSGWLFVPVVAVAAVRFAELPVSITPEEATSLDWRAPRTATGTVLSFTWTVAVLALQAQLLNRASGLAALIVAFFLGLALVALRLREPPAGRARAAATAVAAFLPMLFWLALLMPSLAGARYLLDIGLRGPAAHRLVTSAYVEGNYERWYSTELDEAAALSAVNAAFRSPPVSAHSDAEGHGLTGLIFGYRIEARYWARGTASSREADCPHTVENCVHIVVRRSST